MPSGYFLTNPYCRISSYLQSMAAEGYNPLVAIQIALAGNAAHILSTAEQSPDTGS